MEGNTGHSGSTPALGIHSDNHADGATRDNSQRKLTAILCADVQGYSRLMGADEEATIEPGFSLEKRVSHMLPFKDEKHLQRLMKLLRQAGLKQESVTAPPSYPHIRLAPLSAFAYHLRE